MTLKSSDFADYFFALHGFHPMQWQLEAAESACAGEWKDVISLPTGAGKTSTIDIALFALAVQAELPSEQRTAPMRTFLVVDRRTVVNEAFVRACKLKSKLEKASEGILKVVADQLRSYGIQSPVVVRELRGGIYRDPGWCDSLTQPMIVTSTVDQVGSRLLFRGYGVSNSSRPIQAAVIAHDSLLILDEAHISKPFAQTLAYVQRYQQQRWSDEAMPLPMRVVEMTATPQNTDGTRLEISAEELSDSSSHIGNIVSTPKRTVLDVAEKVKGAKAPDQLGKYIAETASGYAFDEPNDPEESGNDSPSTLKVIGLIVNTVATAKAAYTQLCKHKNISVENVHLIIGSMRPIDRDEQVADLRRLISTGSDRSQIDEPIFVVATQCIEVGADYDFDVLVTEAAPISSLVQRFGRLNRAGRRGIEAVGHIVMRGDRVKTNKQLETEDAAFRMVDPIYGNALSYSWNWLCERAVDGVVDFGISAFRELTLAIDEKQRQRISVDDDESPVLLPAHLDLLSQTTIDPHPNPDVAVWLHGPQRNDGEVQVCWRADLNSIRVRDEAVDISFPQSPRRSDVSTDDADAAIRAVSLCPPSAIECMSVRFVRIKKWLESIAKGRKVELDASADVPSIVEEHDIDSQILPSMFCPVAWRGAEKSRVVTSIDQIRPGDTLVFSVLTEGWNDLGFIPNADKPLHDDEKKPLRDRLLQPEAASHVSCNREEFENLVAKLDRGTDAFETKRQRSIVRIHPVFGCSSALAELRQLSQDAPSIHNDDIRELFRRELKVAVGDSPLPEPLPRLKHEYYIDDKPAKGIVIYGPQASKEVILPDDDGEDVYSTVERGQPVPLAEHCEHVKEEVLATLNRLNVAVPDTLRSAALCHDWGKADVRFQAMLLRGDVISTYLADQLFAKSDDGGLSRTERRRIRERAELPAGFRHELLSTSLIEKSDLQNDVEDFELLLQIVASHHGYARPWCPATNDDSPPEVSLQQIGVDSASLTEEERQAIQYDAVDSSIVARFSRLNRKYGWWGVAFLESILRLADRRASSIESALQSQKQQPVEV